VLAQVSFKPIGVLRTPFTDRLAAPRQASASEGAEGRVELFPGSGVEDALSDLDGWERIWVVFVFHLNTASGFRPKVLPPRSTKRRGVFATRSPYRPNPIGLSAVQLLEVRGLTLRVRDLDMVDGSPVLDIKPYVPYADAFPTARVGWLGPLVEPGVAEAAPRDPEAGFVVGFGALAEAQLAWLRREHALDLAPEVTRVLALGPQPHAYRRIRVEGDGFRLALHDWRVRFRVVGREVTVHQIYTGYRPAELAAPASRAVEIQRSFVDRFGSDALP